MNLATASSCASRTPISNKSLTGHQKPTNNPTKTSQLPRGQNAHNSFTAILPHCPYKSLPHFLCGSSYTTSSQPHPLHTFIALPPAPQSAQRENNSTHLGGAISISVESTLIIQRGATSIFHKDCTYSTGGGALFEDDNSTVYCSGRGIIFEYNTCMLRGDAIYTTSSSVEVVESLSIGNCKRCWWSSFCNAILCKSFIVKIH